MFKFNVSKPTKYTLSMTTTSGEKNTDLPSYAINVDSDLPPSVQIRKPEQAEVEIPANGQLAVDAIVGDDSGIDKVRLRLRVNGNG